MSTPPSRKPAATAPARPASPGRPKDLAKGAAILMAAKRRFTSHGSARTTRAQTASEPGASKPTAHSHSANKKPLLPARANRTSETRLPDPLSEPSPHTRRRDPL